MAMLSYDIDLIIISHASLVGRSRHRAINSFASSTRRWFSAARLKPHHFSISLHDV